MITGGKQHLTSVLLGVVAGLLLINAYGMFFKRDAVTSSTISEDALTPRQKLELAESRLQFERKGSSDFAGSDKAKQLEAKIEELREKVEARDERASREDQDPRPAESLDQQKEHALSVWRNQLAAHDAEPVNPVWSAKVSPGMDADFQRFSSQLGFGVSAADCRSNTCTVEAEWPSFRDATENYDQVVNQQFTNNCAVMIILPDPAKGSDGQPYKARYLFHSCEPSSEMAALDHAAR